MPPIHSRDDVESLFDQLQGLTPIQKDAIKNRYRFTMREYRRRCLLYSYLFYVLKLTMTVGSLAVPALLTIQTDAMYGSYMYWVTWAISLAVTTANGIMTLFKLDKRFLTIHATAERLRTETWQYFMLAGRYSGHHGRGRPTHASQYVYYCSQLEKIHMKQVDEEFIKVGDLDKNHQQATAAAAGGDAVEHVVGGGGGRRIAASSTMVPTPADQAALMSPPVTRRQRGESQESVRTDGTASTVSVHNETEQTVQSAGDIRLTVLPAASEVSTEPAIGVGTVLPAGTVQSQPADSGNA